MIKKIIGVLFLLAAVALPVIAFFNGDLFADKGSPAATYGTFLGQLIPTVLYIFSGIFCLTFDNATKLSYIDGFKKRGKQSVTMVVFIVIYALMVVFAVIGTGIKMKYVDSLALWFINGFLAMLPYFIPFMIFFFFVTMYAAPHWHSKGYFVKNAEALNEYLSYDETFYTYSQDNFVLASQKALFFPTLFCVIPFEQIASAKRVKQLWEQDVYFELTNGKKFVVITKHYDNILTAINNNQAK